MKVLLTVVEVVESWLEILMEVMVNTPLYPEIFWRVHIIAQEKAKRNSTFVRKWVVFENVENVHNVHKIDK